MTATLAAAVDVDDRQAWLEWRAGGIGSSDAAAIAGLDPFRGPLAVWLEKSGRISLDREESEYMRWGRLLEDAICKEFEARTELYVPVRQSAVENATRPWLRATIDGFVHDRPDRHRRHLPLGILEVKTVAGFKSDAWAISDENPTGVPDHFRVQVLHQLGVSDLQHAWIAVLFGGQRLEIRELERDDADLAALIDLEDAFWARVLSGSPPAGDGSNGSTEALRLAYANGGGEAIVLPVEAGELIQEREAAKAEEKAAAVRCAAAEQSLMAMLGDSEIGMYDGQRRITWKRSDRKAVDLEALRTNHPEVARLCEKTTSVRTLRFVGSKADNGGDS